MAGKNGKARNVFLKAYLWHRLWAIIGVLYLLFLGPFFLRFTPSERNGLLVVGGITAIFLVAIFSFLSYRTVLPFRKFFEEPKGVDRARVLNEVFKVSRKFFFHTLFAFTVGTVFVVFALNYYGILVGYKAVLALLWGIGTAFGVAWVSAVGGDYFLHEFYKSLCIRRDDEIKARKNITSLFVFWFLPGIFFAVYFTGLIVFATAKYDFRMAMEGMAQQIQSAQLVAANASTSNIYTQKIAFLEKVFTGSLLKALMIFGVIIILLASVAPLTAVNRIKSTLQELEKGLRKFGEGDLGGEVLVTSADDLGYLAASFNHMVASMKALVEKIQEASSTISTSADQIQSAVSEQTAMVSENSTAIAEITTAIEQLHKSAQDMVEMAQQLSMLVDRFYMAASEGGEDILSVLSHIKGFVAEIEQISQKMLDLEKKTAKIDEVMHIIESIADETHILSINAAIEAATAGEHGRRFAVVAAEVRRLAEESRKAAKDISTVLEDIKRGVEDTFQATEKSVSNAHKAQKKADRAIEGIRVIREESTKAKDFTQRIVLTINQSKTALDQVSLSMEEIAKATERSLVTMKEIESAVNSLVNVIRELRKHTEKFKLGNGER